MSRRLTEIEAFRAQELLVQRATEGLDAREAAELAALGADDDESFDLAAASIPLATLPIEPLPAHLAERISRSAGVPAQQGSSMITTLAGVAPARRAVPASADLGEDPSLVRPTAPMHVSTPAPGTVEGAPLPSVTVETIEPRRFDAPVIPIERKRSRWATVLAIAAAASLLLGVGATLWATQRAPRTVIKETIVEVPVQPPPKVDPTPREARAQLLASAQDVTKLAWTATADPNGKGATGDVVWSKAQQIGYMRFVGLTPNDAKRIQYQLWIFDKERDQAFPVDGGVFDVSSTGEVIVPIRAKLAVDEPVLFAVTIEAPGGVVVSKRERIVVTAAPPKTG